MSVHRFKTVQFLPADPATAWNFFSDPKNLGLLTPPEMRFRITTPGLSPVTYAGQIIAYTLYPLPGIQMKWVTEITHVAAPDFFVDEQRKGPYRIWHHEHHFKEVADGIEMTDLLHYELPLGCIGDIIHSIYVRRKIEYIFDFRRKVLETLFKKV